MQRATRATRSLLLRGRGLSSSAKPSYPNLMEPLILHAAGGITLKNRAVMGSMHTGLEENGFLFPSQLDDLAEYFAERARGGVGLMVTGGIAPNNAGRTFYGAAKMSSPTEAGTCVYVFMVCMCVRVYVCVCACMMCVCVRVCVYVCVRVCVW